VFSSLHARRPPTPSHVRTLRHHLPPYILPRLSFFLSSRPRAAPRSLPIQVFGFALGSPYIYFSSLVLFPIVVLPVCRVLLLVLTACAYFRRRYPPPRTVPHPHLPSLALLLSRTHVVPPSPRSFACFLARAVCLCLRSAKCESVCDPPVIVHV